MSKRLVVLAGTLVSVALLMPPVSATNANQISLPFTIGKANITEIAATFTKTTSDSTVGIPFTLRIPNPQKLPSKIRIAAIGQLNGVTGGPGNTVLTYQIFIAIDATGLLATSIPSGGSALPIAIAGGNFQSVKPGKYAVPASCTGVGSAATSSIKVGLVQLPRLNFEEFGSALKKACPASHK